MLYNIWSVQKSAGVESYEIYPKIDDKGISYNSVSLPIFKILSTSGLITMKLYVILLGDIDG